MDEAEDSDEETESEWAHAGSLPNRSVTRLTSRPHEPPQEPERDQDRRAGISPDSPNRYGNAAMERWISTAEFIGTATRATSNIIGLIIFVSAPDLASPAYS